MKDYTPGRDLNKTSLAEAVAERLGVDLDTGEAAVHAVLDTIMVTVSSGYNVAVTNFGSWHAVYTPARRAHNPQTMEAVIVPEGFRVKWSTSPKFRDAINDRAPKTIKKDPSV